MLKVWKNEQSLLGGRQGILTRKRMETFDVRCDRPGVVSLLTDISSARGKGEFRLQYTIKIPWLR
jgi:hypothetical protein